MLQEGTVPFEAGSGNPQKEVADARTYLKRLDGWVRSRLRTASGPNRNEFELGIRPSESWEPAIVMPKGGWHTAHSYVVTGTISARLQKKEYIPLFELYGNPHEGIEPPYARSVRTVV